MMDLSLPLRPRDAGSRPLGDRLRWLLARLRLVGRVRLGPGARVDGRVWIHGGGEFDLGPNARLDGTALPIELHAERGARIEIGRGAWIDGGTSIEATAEVTIGEDARLGRRCKVMDCNFHLANGDRRRRPPSIPVRIGSGAVLGDGVILLPGARVEPGAHVPSGTVVRGPLGGTTGPLAVAPNPARCLPVRGEREGRAHHLLRLLAGHPGHVLREVLGAVRGALVLRDRERGARVRVLGPLRIVREGRLRVGARSTFVGGMIPTLLAARAGGSLELGESAYVNYGAILEAHGSISVGARCLVASMVRVVDHRDGLTAPIVIGDDVWLGHGVVIAPGVSVGSGSVVAAGTTVHESVPSGSLVSGSPARARPLFLGRPGR